MTPEEEALCALCIWREARGEGPLGMQAVAWVIWNRHIKWGKTVYDVIMGPNQFTSMTVEKNPPSPPPGDPQYNQAFQIVSGIQSGAVNDPTNGSCYYYNPTTADSPWFVNHIVNDPENHPLMAKIGRQEFFA